jgi:nitroreductase
MFVRHLFKFSASILFFMSRVLRRLQMKSLCEHSLKWSNLLTIYGASNDQIVSLIGDKGHKLLHEALGQEIPSNLFFLEILFDQVRKRKIESEIVPWAKDIHSKFLNDRLYDQRRTENNNQECNINDNAFQIFYELSQNRQSVRKFLPTPVPKDVVEKIMLCGIEAPSSCNRQAWRFITFTNKSDREFLSRIRNVNFLKDAPLIICVLVNSELYSDKKELEITSLMDASAMIMTILYACTANDLGSCWVNFAASLTEKKRKLFRKHYHLDGKYKPISLIAVGFPAQTIAKPKREDLKKYRLI